METTTHGWNRLDTGRGVWAFEYAFSKHGRANCLVVQLRDRKLLVLSPAAEMPDGAFADLEELGDVSHIVATNGFHHLGLSMWRARFPGARCFAPAAAMARIAKQNPQAGPLEPLSALQPLLPEDVIVREAPSTKCGECWAIVPGTHGAIWYVSDLLANLPEAPPHPVVGLLFRLTGSAPGYRVFNLATTFILKDKRVVFRAMLDDLAAQPPHMVVPAHGVPLSGDDVAGRTRALLETRI